MKNSCYYYDYYFPPNLLYKYLIVSKCCNSNLIYVPFSGKFKMKDRDQFVHSNGTTLIETFSVIVPFFFYTFIYSTFTREIIQRETYIKCFVMEFLLIILPAIFTVTLLVPYVNIILPVLLAISVSTYFILNREDEKPSNTTKEKAYQFDFITLARSTINILSVLGILAVDFPLFPRRFAKTITYGYSLMDVGVGLFIFSNGLVAPELRGHKNSLIKSVKSVTPLVLIGMLRFFVTKEIDYHVAVTEYGVHWNFFITLAATKIFVSMILSFVSVENSIFSGISLLLAHEIILQLGVAKYVLSSAPRNTFFAGNREGIVSSLGYVSLYYLSVSFGRFIRLKYNKISRFKLFCNFFAMSAFLLWATFILDKNFGVSRRLANSGYCVWIMFIGVTMTGLFHLGTAIPEYIDSPVKVPLIFEAVNYNGLAFFLLANLLTGLVNVVFDTLTFDSSLAVLILVLYMLINCAVVTILYKKSYKLKL